MTFSEALEAAKSGRKVQRQGWNGKGQHVELAWSVVFMDAEGNSVKADHEAIGSSALTFFGTSGIQIGWLASSGDILADDWQLADGEEAWTGSGSDTGFGAAVDALKAGKAATRRGWNGKNMRIELDSSCDKLSAPFIYIVVPNGMKFAYAPSQADLLAEDWKIF